MDTQIWRRLPCELIEYIIRISTLSTDSKIQFKIFSKLNVSLPRRTGIMYNVDTFSLHVFLIPGVHIIRRPIHIDQFAADMCLFNVDGSYHMRETNDVSGCMAILSDDYYYTEKEVLFIHESYRSSNREIIY